MTELADDEARSRIAEEFGASFFVETAAGSGKTTALVRRIVGLIGAGIGTLKRIVAITFTEALTGGQLLIHNRANGRLIPAAAAAVFKALAVLDPTYFQYTAKTA